MMHVTVARSQGSQIGAADSRSEYLSEVNIIGDGVERPGAHRRCRPVATASPRNAERAANSRRDNCSREALLSRWRSFISCFV